MLYYAKVIRQTLPAKDHTCALPGRRKGRKEAKSCRQITDKNQWALRINCTRGGGGVCLEPSGCQASADHWLKFGQEGSSQGHCRPEWERMKRKEWLGGGGGGWGRKGRKDKDTGRLESGREVNGRNKEPERTIKQKDSYFSLLVEHPSNLCPQPILSSEPQLHRFLDISTGDNRLFKVDKHNTKYLPLLLTQTCISY